jgi:hypothetical protein
MFSAAMLWIGDLCNTTKHSYFNVLFEPIDLDHMVTESPVNGLAGHSMPSNMRHKGATPVKSS